MSQLTIVTAGAGFIGGHLVERLARSGQTVRVIERPGILTKEGATELINENIEIAESDAIGTYCLSKLRAENVAMERARAGIPL